MRILSIESSTRCASVAVATNCISNLSDDSNQILSAHLPSAGNSNELIEFLAFCDAETIGKTGPVGASAALPPVIEQVLRVANTSVSELGLITVSLGPGSFTGLRVGIVTAKTLAFATGCPVVGVHVADVLAFQALNALQSSKSAQNLAIGLDIGRGEILSFEYELSPDGFQRTREGKILKPEEWAADFDAGQWVTGSGLRFIAEDVKNSWKIPQNLQPDARAVAILGADEFATKGAADFWGLEPIYSRPSSAEEARKKK